MGGATRLAVSTVLAALVVVAVAPAAQPKTRAVKAGGNFPLYTWEPSAIHLAVGDRIVWKNPTDSEHHVAPYKGKWNDTLHVDVGGTASFRFRRPGTYLYRCDLDFHSYFVGDRCFGQCGRVVVHK